MHCKGISTLQYLIILQLVIIVCRVANSTFNYVTNCLIVFATTIKCTPATDVQFNALHIDHYMFIHHHNLPEHLLNYVDIDNILLVLRSVIGLNYN